MTTYPPPLVNIVCERPLTGITHPHLGPNWYCSEPSNIPYSPNQCSFLGGTFFAICYGKTALDLWST